MSAVEPVVHAAEWDLGPYLPLCDRGGACVGCGAQRDLSVPHADGCYALAMMIELSALRAWKREAEPLLEVLRGKLGTESAWTGIDAEWSEQMGELDRLIGSQRV